MDDLHFDGNKLRSANPALQLDFGAYVKCYGVNRAIDELRRHGVRNAIVNAGGDLRAIGRKGDRPWRIGIRDPRGPGILASIEIQGDESVFTSGDYERFFMYQGKRYHHIIDPRSGYPPDGAMSATVIYPGGGVGGGASTALMVAGPKDWMAVVRGMHLKQAMLVAADRKVYMTPALAARIHFEVEPPPAVIIGQP
jgi:thiamine biosynthesis lipoprotein